MFVTYAHEDAALVYPYIRWLQDQGFNIWWDEGISPGAAWRVELAQALREARNPHALGGVLDERGVWQGSSKACAISEESAGGRSRHADAPRPVIPPSPDVLLAMQAAEAEREQLSATLRVPDLLPERPHWLVLRVLEIKPLQQDRTYRSKDVPDHALSG